MAEGAITDSLEAGRAALRQGAWQKARARFDLLALGAFAYSSETQIRAVIDADVAVQQARALLEQEGIAVPA